MAGMFNFENPFWQFMGKLGDVMVLNLLWVVCSLPVITAGAATAAIYDVLLRIAREEDGHTVRRFFTAFRKNFAQATGIWMIFLAVGGLLVLDYRFYLLWPEKASPFGFGLMVMMMGASFLFLFVLLYAFPLQARFENPVMRTLKNALVMSFAHLPYTMLMIGVNALLFYLMTVKLPVLLLFGYGLAAFFNAHCFHRIFKRYILQEEQ